MSVLPLFVFMVEVVRQVNALEERLLGSPDHGELGIVQGCHEVKSPVIASRTADCLINSLGVTWDITGIFTSVNYIQNKPKATKTPKYIVYAYKIDNLLRCVSTPYHLVVISIPDSVRELGDGCFKWCECLRRVIFGPSSSLERIGVSCFQETGLSEVSVPDSVRELCDCCFSNCWILHRVTFGPSSSLERIGVAAFVCVLRFRRHSRPRRLVEISIPDGVRELCDGCFKRCESLRRVTFGPCSSLERIGVSCFEGSGVEEFVVPDSVRELCDRCFKECKGLRRITFGPCSSLEQMGVDWILGTSVEEVAVPDCVRDVCDGCFKGCESLRRVAFGPSSLLERIGVSCFDGTRVEEFYVPDGVRELCDGCFKRCESLRRVTFGPSSALERIGVSCFDGTRVEEFYVPDSVRELCNLCFAACRSLRRVTFGPCSSLERIGVRAFGVVVRGDWSGYNCGPCPCGLIEISIPDSVCELCDYCFKGCSSLRRVTFGPSSSLLRVGAMCFSGCGLIDFEIPVSVRAIGGGAFGECALEGGIVCRDGCSFRAIDGLILSDDFTMCFSGYGVLSSVSVPDSVRELCDGCFKECKDLRRITFGPSSSLERIGVSCFERSGVEELSVPDRVRELCDGCFKECKGLRRITFGPSSSLERIGFDVFPKGLDRMLDE